MTNSDIMMVHPGQIVIDMPIDEQNVSQKMESMKERGIIQPVTLWLQGMRVIDGFHRSVAAQRLGWDEIPCYVVDCNEDAFWDARIQSARQHHRIERERLTAWILESWKTTEWYAKTNIDPELIDIYGSNNNDWAVALSILGTLWSVYKKDGVAKMWREEAERKPGQKGRLPLVFQSDGNSPRKVNASLVDWIESKAQRWGIAGDEIVDKIFDAYPNLYLSRTHLHVFSYSLDKMSRDLDLTFNDRQKIASKIDISPILIDRRSIDFEEWVKEQAKKPTTDQVRLSEYVALKQVEEKQKQRAQEDAEHAAMVELMQRERTPQEQAEIHKQRVQIVKEAMDRVAWTARSVDHLISDSQDFSAPIAETIATLTDFHNEHFKRKDTKLKDLIASRNAQLRKEVKALTEKVASLERALNTKQTVTPRLKNVMVEHAQ